MGKFYNYLQYGMNKAIGLNINKKKELSFSLKNKLFCQFNNKPCFSKDFTWFFSYLYGNYFQFNPKESPTQISGPINGLKYPTFYASGFKIFLDNNSFFSSISKQTFVETGKFTSIELKKNI
jgi:hypothetical protein